MAIHVIARSKTAQRSTGWWIASLALAITLITKAHAQAPAIGLDHDKPIEIAADSLEVLQADKKAIFTGNVIATQGNINMKAARMLVFYRDAAGASTTGGAASGQGIYKIEAQGEVFFASPQETAQGDSAVYNVDTDTIDLLGNVLLTREKNVLKGTRLNYNLATGRSVLVGGASAGGSGRVRGLFLPQQTKPQAGQ